MTVLAGYEPKPIPHIDGTSGVAIGELILNGFLYMVVLIVVLAVLNGLLIAIVAFKDGAKRGWEKERQGKTEDERADVPPSA